MLVFGVAEGKLSQPRNLIGILPDRQIGAASTNVLYHIFRAG